MTGLTDKSTPELSIILATVNDSIACNLTLAQIIAQLQWDQISYEIILIDNNSESDQKAILEQFLRYHTHLPIKYFNFETPGTIPIHAFGVEQAQGKYITMPEPHVVLSPHYYQTLLTQAKQLQGQGGEMIFSAFNTGSLRTDNAYLKETTFIKRNPFGKASGGGGDGCMMTDPPQPIFTGAFCGMVCTKDWLLKIGNMFPQAFLQAGGYIAEAILLGLLTWMFGKKCYVVPQAVLEHPVYRIHKGPGRNENMAYSMAVGAYICGGDKYLLEMEKEFGGYEAGLFDTIRQEAKEAREYVEKNAGYSLEELSQKWEEIKNDTLVS